MSKTLQGRDDEQAEREEVEAQREREARAEEEEMMAGVEVGEEEEEGEEGEEGGEGGGVVGGEGGDGGEDGEEEGAGGVDLDADVPDADAGGEWSDDDDDDDDEDDERDDDDEVDEEGMRGGGGEEAEEEEGQAEDVEEYDSADAAMTGPSRRPMGIGMGMGMGMFDGPATPPPNDRTPQRFRLNPFQAPTGEGDGDYGSPLAARHSQRAAAARARDVSPGVVAAAAVASRRGVVGGGMASMDAAVRLGGQPSGSRVTAPATTPQHASFGVSDMEEADLDDSIPMDETMMEGGSYEHTDTEVEDPSSEDDGMPGSSSNVLGGVGSRSVFGRAAGGSGGVGGGIAAAVRRLSGQDRRSSGVDRRASGGGEGRASGSRRTSGRGRG